MKIETIYILLLNEDIDVWRPSNAVNVKENIYEILIDQSEYETDEEDWEFKPGEKFLCKTKIFSNGTENLIAYSSL
jgi:hypothetical protein